jgi:hypothetical protein
VLPQNAKVLARGEKEPPEVVTGYIEPTDIRRLRGV